MKQNRIILIFFENCINSKPQLKFSERIAQLFSVHKIIGSKLNKRVNNSLVMKPPAECEYSQTFVFWCCCLWFLYEVVSYVFVTASVVENFEMRFSWQIYSVCKWEEQLLAQLLGLSSWNAGNLSSFILQRQSFSMEFLPFLMCLGKGSGGVCLPAANTLKYGKIERNRK